MIACTALQSTSGLHTMIRLVKFGRSGGHIVSYRNTARVRDVNRRSCTSEYPNYRKLFCSMALIVRSEGNVFFGSIMIDREGRARPYVVRFPNSIQGPEATKNCSVSRDTTSQMGSSVHFLPPEDVHIRSSAETNLNGSN